MGPAIAITGLLLAAAASPLAGQAFEGTIVTQIYEKGKPQSELVTSYKGPRTRLELPGREAGGYLLMNTAAGTWQTVMPERKMYMTMDVKEMADDKGKRADPPKITPTGKTETIAGHTCEHYSMVDSDGAELDVCAARGLGTFGMGGRGPGGKGAPGMSSLPLEYRHLAATFKDGFQPLKTERVRQGTRELLMQVKSIERKSLPAAMFEIPAGYQEFNMNAMMKGKIPKIPGRPPR